MVEHDFAALSSAVVPVAAPVAVAAAGLVEPAVVFEQPTCACFVAAGPSAGIVVI